MSEQEAVVENETTEILTETPEQEVTNEQVESTTTDVSTTNTEVEETTEETQTDEAQEQVPAVKPQKSWADRKKEIDAKTYKMHRERQILEDAHKKNEQILQQIQEAQGPLKPPDPDNYDDEEKFQNDNKVYQDKVINIEAQKRAQHLVQQQNAQRAQSEENAKWNYKREKAIENNPDFTANEGKITNALQAFKTKEESAVICATITTSEQAEPIVNYLAKHPEEMEKIAAMPTLGAIKEMGKLEWRLSQKPKKKLTSIPEPVTPETGSGSVPKNLASMSQTEYADYMNKQQYGN